MGDRNRRECRTVSSIKRVKLLVMVVNQGSLITTKIETEVTLAIS